MNITFEEEDVGNALQFAFAVIFIGGLFGNILIIASISLISSLKTRNNAFLLSLAIADFLILSFVLLVRIDSFYHTSLFELLLAVLCISSVFHLVTISISISKNIFFL